MTKINHTLNFIVKAPWDFWWSQSGCCRVCWRYHDDQSLHWWSEAFVEGSTTHLEDVQVKLSSADASHRKGNWKINKDSLIETIGSGRKSRYGKTEINEHDKDDDNTVIEKRWWKPGEQQRWCYISAKISLWIKAKDFGIQLE